MHCETWIPGSNNELDQLFDRLREQQHQKKEHPLWKNYSKQEFDECAILSIAFDSTGNPEFCSSALTRKCWPSTAYRIINRVWKINPQDGPLKQLKPSGGLMLLSQIDWLNQNTDCNLVFVSRQGPRWQQFAINQYRENFNLEFKTDTYKYRTCATPNDDDCWQHIIYQGNESVLLNWERK